MPLVGVSKRQLGLHKVAVPSAIANYTEITMGLEFGDDSLDRALGDLHSIGDIAHTSLGLFNNAEQHMSMIGQKRPVRVLLLWIGFLAHDFE
jgi:hypothetical protein